MPFVLSTAGSASIEDVAAVATGPLWFQLYMWRDREITASLVDRAIVADYDTLCLTVDLPMSGHRERDPRNGFVIPPRVTLRNAIDIARHPRWARRVLGGPPVTFGNFADRGGPSDVVTLGQIVNRQLNPTATWDDAAWLRRMWPRTMVIKGILDVDDARRAADAGADGIVVSNHGGRQLDASLRPSTCCPRSSTSSATASRCSSTAASVAGPMWSRHLGSERATASSPGPTCTASPPAELREYCAASTCLSARSTARWPLLGCPSLAAIVDGRVRPVRPSGRSLIYDNVRHV